jgi:hypothetical protein
MSQLQDFVLGFYQLHGGLVEPPRYGAYEVLLPDEVAERLQAPAVEEVVFDDTGPGEEDGHLHLGPGHPLVERMVEITRQDAAPAQAYINAVRLDKRGLADAARQALTFANARLVTLPGQMETPALFHYLLLDLRLVLLTDEKHELLDLAAMDMQSGWPVDWSAIQAQATLSDEPAFASLPVASPLWIADASPLTPSSLAGLFARAQAAVLGQEAQAVSGLSRRAARFLELDRARLEQYYDDLQRDLERRLARSEGERQASLREKLAAVRTERELKLADAEARYRLRIDLGLVSALVVAQPKLILQVQIENRGTAIQRRVVWDPLLHQIEPLRCDVCGRPGASLHLCSGGHLSHADCLLEQQCVECKRVYCRLCGEQMTACEVCGRPVCRSSLIKCSECGKGTCREHTGACHAPTPAAVPSKQVAAPPAPAPGKPVRAKAGTRPVPPPPTKEKATKPVRPQAKPAPQRTANWKLDVQIERSEPVVTAYVLSSGTRGPAVRSWRLGPQGIEIHCRCAKGEACPAHGNLLRPTTADGIEAQMQTQIDELRAEYAVPARNVSYTLFMGDMPSTEPRLILRGKWKDEATLEQARTGWAQVAARQGIPLPPPPRPKPRALTDEEAKEAEQLLIAANGLVTLEGAVKETDLYEQMREFFHPGDWYTPAYLDALLRTNDHWFKVQASGWVASTLVSNVQRLLAAKKAAALPPRSWSLVELLAAGDLKRPLTEREARIQCEMHGITHFDHDLRAIQDDLRNGLSEDVLVDEMVSYYRIKDPEAIVRLADLVAELVEHTPRWELGGRTPAEARSQ